MVSVTAPVFDDTDGSVDECYQCHAPNVSSAPGTVWCDDLLNCRTCWKAKSTDTSQQGLNDDGIPFSTLRFACVRPDNMPGPEWAYFVHIAGDKQLVLPPVLAQVTSAFKKSCPPPASSHSFAKHMKAFDEVLSRQTRTIRITLPPHGAPHPSTTSESQAMLAEDVEESMGASLGRQNNIDKPSCGGCGDPHCRDGPSASQCCGCGASFCGKTDQCQAAPRQSPQLPSDWQWPPELMLQLVANGCFFGDRQLADSFWFWLHFHHVHPNAILAEMLTLISNTLDHTFNALASSPAAQAYASTTSPSSPILPLNLDAICRRCCSQFLISQFPIWWTWKLSVPRLVLLPGSVIPVALVYVHIPDPNPRAAIPIAAEINARVREMNLVDSDCEMARAD